MKTITKIFSTIFKTAILIVIAAILIPVVYFGYRITQPMDLPQFKGLSLYQLIAFDKMCADDSAIMYDAKHSDSKFSTVEYAQYLFVNLAPVVIQMPLESFVVTGADALHQQQRIEPSDYNSDASVDWFNFLPSWWGVAEKMLWLSGRYSAFPTDWPAYCKKVPSPAEFKAVQQAHQEMQQTASRP